MGLIYKITNDINDKVYIGQTRQTLNRRWHAHLQDYKTATYTCKLYNAILKYGEEHFNIEIVEDNILDALLNDREIYYIKFFNSYYNGYNSTLGGEGDTKYDKEKMLSLWNQGLTCSDIAKILGCQYMTVSYALETFGIDSQQKSERSAKIRKNKNGTPILQYDFQGNLIRRYESSSDVKEYGFDRNEVNRCCNYKNCSRKVYQHKGFLWKRENDSTPIEEIIYHATHIDRGDSWRGRRLELDLDKVRKFYIEENHTIAQCAINFNTTKRRMDRFLIRNQIFKTK